MLYYDDTNKTGLCQEIDDLCGTSAVSYPLAAKLRRMNSGLDEYAVIALRECGNWTAEDTGETDLPLATTNLVSGQSDYAFPSELLSLVNLTITAADGVNEILLTPIDFIPLNQASGQPTSYKKVGNSFILSPTPNYSLSAGIQSEYRRGFNYATLSGTTFTPTSPGIPTIFHPWLARKASLPYLVSKGIKSKNDIASLITTDEAGIVTYFGQKKRDQTGGFKVKQESTR